MLGFLFMEVRLWHRTVLAPCAPPGRDPGQADVGRCGGTSFMTRTGHERFKIATVQRGL